jgi:hypothetical protein
VGGADRQETGKPRVRAQASSSRWLDLHLTPTGPPTRRTRPADSIERNQNESLRLTMQLSPRNKVTLQHQNASQQRPFYGYSLGQLTSAPEAIYWSKSAPMYQSQAGWNSPLTSKLLSGRRPVQQQGLPDAAAAGQRAQSGGVPRHRHRLQLGQLRQHLWAQRQPQLQHAGRRVVRDRFARLQGGRDLHAPLGLDIVRRGQPA